MKRNGLRGVWLASALAFGISPTIGRGEEVILPPPTPVPATTAAPAAEPATATDGVVDGTPKKRWVPGGLLFHPNERPSLVRWFHNQDWLCCHAHHNTLGCGSLNSECKFIFGSCRTFYGEPCDKSKPGATGGPFQKAGCNCP